MDFVREGPVTDVVKFQTLAILHKYHFDVMDVMVFKYFADQVWIGFNFIRSGLD